MSKPNGFHAQANLVQNLPTGRHEAVQQHKENRDTANLALFGSILQVDHPSPSPRQHLFQAQLATTPRSSHAQQDIEANDVCCHILLPEASLFLGVSGESDALKMDAVASQRANVGGKKVFSLTTDVILTFVICI